MIGYHCDGPECDTWTLSDGGFLDSWLEVNTLNDYGRMMHFCCMDCCGKYMITKSSPTETI